MLFNLYFQVCLEGQISRKSAMKSLSEGRSPSGDQIPWKFCEQFQDNVFPSLSGARIVRIAVHPSALRVHSSYLYVTWFTYNNIILYALNILCLMQLGYGSAAVDLLTRYSSLHCFSFHLYVIYDYWCSVALILILNYALLDTDFVSICTAYRDYWCSDSDSK